MTMLHAEVQRADDLLLTSDAARLVGKSDTTIRHWERTGRLRSMRTVGGVRLYTRAEVLKAAAAGGAEELVSCGEV